MKHIYFLILLLNPSLIAQTTEFIKGADISYIPQIEDLGGKYYVDGVETDPVEIFSQNQFNYIRLRFWHSPPGGYIGLESTLDMASRIKQNSLKVVKTLAEISGEPVPEKIERSRAQLQDAMLDTHFMLGMSRVALAADPDLLNGFSHLLAGMGAEVVAAVAPANAPALKSVAAETVKLGDLEEMEKLAKQNDAEIIISNSHAVESAERLGIPLLRAGFPQYDLLGGYQKVWVGYQGTRQTLFDLANILLTLERGEIHPYRSIYAQKPEYYHAAEEAIEDTGLRH